MTTSRWLEVSSIERERAINEVVDPRWFFTDYANCFDIPKGVDSDQVTQAFRGLGYRLCIFKE